MEYIRKLIKNKYFYLLLIIAIAAFLRFYQLGKIPAGLLNDEANKGYDAYSLLMTGRDQWGSFLPLTNLRGFGDYPPPMYQYLSIIPIYIWGLSSFSVRFISAFSGVLSVIAIFYLGRKLFNEGVGLFSAFFLAIMPWAVGLSRTAMESNLAILFLLISLYFGLKNTNKDRLKNLVISSILLAMSLYTYSAYFLFAPLVLVIILFDNFFGKKIRIKEILFPIVIFCLIILPLFVSRGSASVRFSQVGLTTNVNSIGLIDTLNMQRGQCLNSFPPTVCKIMDNKAVLYTSDFIKNYLSHFSFNFLYTSGTVTQYSILEKRGLDYLLNFIFLLSGLLFLIKVNKDSRLFIALISLLLISPIADSLTGDGNYTRASMMIPFLSIMSGLGAYFLWTKLEGLKNINYIYIIYTFTFLVFSFGILTFYISYLTYFKNNYSLYSQYGYADLMSTVSKEKNIYNRIYISRHLNDTKQYIYYLFYTKYNPSEYQSKENVSYSVGQNGWVSIDRIGNIYFVQNPPTSAQLEKDSSIKSLIISNPVDFPKTIKPVFVIKDKLGNVIFEAAQSSDLLEYYREQELIKNKGHV